MRIWPQILCAGARADPNGRALALCITHEDGVTAGALWASAALRLSNVQQQPRPARAVNNSAPVAASVAKPSSAPAVAAKFVQGLSKSGRMAVDQMTDAADYSAKHVAEAIDMVTTKTGVPLPSATAKYFELRKKQKASWKQVIVHKTVLGIEIFGKDSSHLLPTEDHLTCRGSRLPNLPGQVTMRVLYESALCHIVRTSAIVLSFLQEVCKTQFDPSGQGAGSFWSICNVVFLVIFTIELACNLYSGWNLKSFWRAGFNIFDIVLVTVGLVMTLHQAGETNSLADDDTDSTESEVFMILRALRLLRCLRIFRRSRTFQIVVLAVRRALVPIGILIFFMSLYSVIGVTIFRTAVVTTMAQYTDLGNEYGDEYWGNWLAAMLTLFQVFTLENWSAIARPLIFNESWQTSVLAILFFPSFIMINAILVLDLVTSFFVDTVQNEDIQKEFDRKQFEAAHAKAEKVGARHFSQKLKDQLKIKRQHERLEEVRKKTMSIDAKTVEKVGRLVDDLVKRRLAEATGQSPGSALRPVKQPALNLSAAALSRSAGIAAHGSRPCSPGRTCSPSLDELSENSLSFTQQ